VAIPGPPAPSRVTISPRTAPSRRVRDRGVEPLFPDWQPSVVPIDQSRRVARREERSRAHELLSSRLSRSTRGGSRTLTRLNVLRMGDCSERESNPHGIHVPRASQARASTKIPPSKLETVDGCFKNAFEKMFLFGNGSLDTESERSLACYLESHRSYDRR
jgi:hypothetical protein